MRCVERQWMSTPFRFVNVHNLPFGLWLPLEIQNKIMAQKYWMEWKDRVKKVNAVFGFQHDGSKEGGERGVCICEITGLVNGWREDCGLRFLKSVWNVGSSMFVVYWYSAEGFVDRGSGTSLEVAKGLCHDQ